MIPKILILSLFFFLNTLALSPCNTTHQDVTASTSGAFPDIELPDSISQFAVEKIQLVLFLHKIKYAFLEQVESNTRWKAWHIDAQILNLPRMLAQEKARMSAIENLLSQYSNPLVATCRYSFNLSTSESLRIVGSTAMPLPVGFILGISSRLAETDPKLLLHLNSFLAADSRDLTLFRASFNETNNPLFNTQISEVWSFNVALQFVVSGSCINTPALPILGSLNAINPDPHVRAQEFSWNPDEPSLMLAEGKSLYISWVSQVNEPVYTELSITAHGKGTTRVPDGLYGMTYVGISAESQTGVDLLSLGILAGPTMLEMYT